MNIARIVKAALLAAALAAPAAAAPAETMVRAVLGNNLQVLDRIFSPSYPSR